MPRRSRRRIVFISAIIGFFLLYQSLYSGLQQSWHEASSHIRSSGTHSHQIKGSYEDWPGHKHYEITHPVCPPLQGMENVFVVMKTGVTEAPEKVPVHVNTTLRCIPNYAIFSDFEEDIEGVRIRDAFVDIDPEVKEQVPEFKLYNRLREQGRDGLKSQDFQDEPNTVIGKPNNPGWRLDKWKFLPMAHQTLRLNERAEWYFFMEADTYPFWANLLAWIGHFDSSEPHYMGTETQIGDVIFAHGGSGFLVSNPALRRAVDAYLADPVGINTYTDYHWAGDCVLGKVLSDQGVSLRYSWPILQNSNLGELDEFTQDFYRRPWCFPAVALHHLSPSDIRNLWVYEQRRLTTVSLGVAVLKKKKKKKTNKYPFICRPTNPLSFTAISSRILSNQCYPLRPARTGTIYLPSHVHHRCQRHRIAIASVCSIPSAYSFHSIRNIRNALRPRLPSWEVKARRASRLHRDGSRTGFRRCSVRLVHVRWWNLDFELSMSMSMSVGGNRWLFFLFTTLCYFDSYVHADTQCCFLPSLTHARTHEFSIFPSLSLLLCFAPRSQK